MVNDEIMLYEVAEQAIYCLLMFVSFLLTFFMPRKFNISIYYYKLCQVCLRLHINHKMM